MRFTKGTIPWNKGKKMTGYDSGFKKGHGAMGGHKKGTPITEATKRKLSKALKGRKKKPFSLSHRMNLSKAFKGKYTGKNSPSWKGGLSKQNEKARQGIEYKLWRETVFGRDRYICQMPGCKQLERYLQAHHIKKFSKYKDLRYEPTNGITLCKTCHGSIKNREEQYEEMFNEILKAMYGGKEFTL